MPLIVTPSYLAQRADFYYQLSSQVEAGIHVIPALESRLKQRIPESTRAPLTKLVALLQDGHCLADGLDRLDGWLPEFDRSLIRAGEESGRLDVCFRLLSEYYSERAELSKKVIGQSAYPFLVLHTACLIFPPTMLTGLIDGDIATFAIQKLMIFLPLWGLIFFFLYATQREGGSAWSAIMEKLLHRVPLLGSARRNLALGRLALSLESLVTAGVNIIQAWEMSGRACGSPTIDKAVQHGLPKMINGYLPSEVINEHSVFPEMFANLYHSGETAGKLDETLRRLHKHYSDEGFRKMQAFATWAPKMLFGLIGIFVAYFIIKFWMDYFKQIGDVLG